MNVLLHIQNFECNVAPLFRNQLRAVGAEEGGGDQDRARRQHRDCPHPAAGGQGQGFQGHRVQGPPQEAPRPGRRSLGRHLLVCMKVQE